MILQREYITPITHHSNYPASCHMHVVIALAFVHSKCKKKSENNVCPPKTVAVRRPSLKCFYYIKCALLTHSQVQFSEGIDCVESRQHAEMMHATIPPETKMGQHLRLWPSTPRMRRTSERTTRQCVFKFNAGFGQTRGSVSKYAGCFRKRTIRENFGFTGNTDCRTDRGSPPNSKNYDTLTNSQRWKPKAVVVALRAVLSVPCRQWFKECNVRVFMLRYPLLRACKMLKTVLCGRPEVVGPASDWK